MHTFHPRYWIFIVSLSQFMALGLLASPQGLVGELPQHLFFFSKNLITVMPAVVLKPVPALQIRSQHTFTWG